MAKKEKRFVKTYSDDGFVESKTIYVDRETGVNYLFISDGSSAGLTALIDRDGKPLVTPINDYNE
ncbi:MAG: xylan 1,4-beta-xylosidase [Ruminococcus sp.]|nr:xylan 1,4-beta-xylosidase [Ruminococcus sp.]